MPTAISAIFAFTTPRSQVIFWIEKKLNVHGYQKILPTMNTQSPEKEVKMGNECCNHKGQEKLHESSDELEMKDFIY